MCVFLIDGQTARPTQTELCTSIHLDLDPGSVIHLDPGSVLVKSRSKSLETAAGAHAAGM